VIQYENDFKLVAYINQEISDYYFSMIPSWKSANRQKYPAHITIIRSNRETPSRKELWGKYSGTKIDFYYQPYVHEGTVYYWINCFSEEMEEIRRELGLPVVEQFTDPPAGFAKTFHSTIGNKK